jgi:hypothetical protein
MGLDCALAGAGAGLGLRQAGPELGLVLSSRSEELPEGGVGVALLNADANANANSNARAWRGTLLASMRGGRKLQSSRLTPSPRWAQIPNPSGPE